MTSANPDRLDRIEALLEQSLISSNERMDRIDQRIEQFINGSERDRQASNERLTRIEGAIAANTEGMTELRQLVQSNNRFLEAFSAKVDRFVDTVENLSHRLDGVNATANQDRQESNTRLSRIDRLVSAIAKSMGVQ